MCVCAYVHISNLYTRTIIIVALELLQTINISSSVRKAYTHTHTHSNIVHAHYSHLINALYAQPSVEHAAFESNVCSSYTYFTCSVNSFRNKTYILNVCPTNFWFHPHSIKINIKSLYMWCILYTHMRCCSLFFSRLKSIKQLKFHSKINIQSRSHLTPHFPLLSLFSRSFSSSLSLCPLTSQQILLFENILSSNYKQTMNISSQIQYFYRQLRRNFS